MADQELGGNIKLVNFNLAPQEMVVVKKIIGNYASKIRNFHDYEEFKVELRVHKKSKTEKFEIKSDLMFNGELATAEKQGYNLFVLLDEVLAKILHEVEHKVKK